MRVSLQYFVTLTAVIAIAMLPCKVSLGGGYCKWTDENGVVHYAEKCPEKTLTEQVEIQPPPSEQHDKITQRSNEVQYPCRDTGKVQILASEKIGTTTRQH